MDDFDKLIREAGTERTSDRFTAEVMEKIRPLPVPETHYSARIPLWFKIIMIGVFTGALIFTFLSTGIDAGNDGIMVRVISQGLGYFSGLFSAIKVWINMYIWLSPSILFSIAGIFFLLTRKQEFNPKYI